MMWEGHFRAIISGQRRGLGAAATRGSLAIAAKAYAAGIYLRNKRFDLMPHSVQRVSVPVISVGNLTVGGTGKTPLVAWLARWYRDHGLRVALVSRGYGAAQG